MISIPLLLALAASTAGSGWKVTKRVSAVDNKATVQFVKSASAAVLTASGKRFRPALSIACEDVAGTPTVTIGLAVGDYVGTGMVDVRIRWDKLPAEEQRTLAGPPGALFLTSVTIETLMKHSTLTVGYTPYNSSERAAVFALGGLKVALAPHAKACGLQRRWEDLP